MCSKYVRECNVSIFINRTGFTTTCFAFRPWLRLPKGVLGFVFAPFSPLPICTASTQIDRHQVLTPNRTRRHTATKAFLAAQLRFQLG